jgi:putative oxidoreductase
MNLNAKLPLSLRIVVVAAFYVCILGMVYGFASISYRPVVLLWPLVALYDMCRILFSIASWNPELVHKELGAMVLVVIWFVLAVFATGRISLIRMLSIILGLIFIYSAIPKILEVDYFARAVRNYRMLPVWSHNSMALWMPWMELIAGCCLVFKVWERGGATLILGMMVIFLIAVVSAVLRGLDIDCGCFGRTTAQVAKAHQVGLQKIAENLTMTIAAILILLPTRSRTFRS